MTDITDLIAGYIAVWNETDEAARKELITEVFAEDAAYTDPLAEVRGHVALNAVVGAVQGQFPGYRFRLVGSPDAHHDIVRFTWELAEGDAEALVVGFDVAVLDEAGRIASVHGFLDRVPAM